MRNSKRNTSKQSHKRSIFIGVSLLLLLSFSGGAYALYRTTQGSESTNETTTNNSSEQSNDSTQTESPTDKGTPVSEDYKTPSSNDSITISAESSGESVIIRTVLNGYSDGVCTLKMTSGTDTYTDTADVLFTPSQSLCAGFTVPISELSSGPWQITVSVSSGGTTTANNIQFEVKK